MESKVGLLEPLKTDTGEFKNRMVHCAMSRCRAGPDGIPTELHQEYYSSRTSFGLLFTEGTIVMENANGYPGAGCIYEDSHVEGWKKVVDKVH